jgi:ubiquinone/menaquinone biosynthesis C-methylase UbiE
LAAIHHVEEKERFFGEAHRVLREKGTLIIADVREGSAVSEFLDGFVNAHNSMGHRGYYIHSRTATQIERCHFAIVESTAMPFHWHFESPEAMGRFCQLLFGIDRANTGQVIDGLRRQMGYSTDPHACHLNWELLFIKASKL